jgi:predicted RNase H-like HicB family nuclease
MFKDRYVYPAIFNYANDGISVDFPDLPGCLTCGDTTEEALSMAKEAMALHLYGMEQDGDPIPDPTDVRQVKTESNQIVVLIEAWMPSFRDRVENKAVKKTLTLPRWLNDLAEREKVNFSHILQTALKRHLGIEDSPAEKRP